MPLKVVSIKGSPNRYLRGTVAGRSVFRTTKTADPEIAEAKRIKLEAQLLNESVFGPRASRTFGEAAILYVNTVNPTGTQRYSVIGRIRKDGSTSPNLADAWKGLLCSEIDQNHVDAFVRRRYPTAAASTLMRQVYTPAIAVLSFAAKRGWCDTPKLDRPKLTPAQRRGKQRWSPLEEARAVVEGAAAHLQPLALMLYWAGPRLSEALELDWPDVDLAARWAVLRDTKNGWSRGIPLHMSVVVALANLKHRTGPVFRTQLGEPYADHEREYGGQIATAWETACRHAGLCRREGSARHGKIVWTAKPISPHACRHSFSSWLTQAGVHEQVRDEIMGHLTSDMGRRYAHVPQQHLIAAVDRLPGYEGALKAAREIPVKRLSTRG